HPIDLNDPDLPRPYANQIRYRYRHRFVIAAPNERAARVRATAALPDNGFWSDFEPEGFDLDEAQAGTYTLAVEVTLSADAEAEAKEQLVQLFGDLVDPATMDVHVLTEDEKRQEDEETLRNLDSEDDD